MKRTILFAAVLFAGIMNIFKIFSNFIDWIDDKLRINRLLSVILGYACIVFGLFISSRIYNHTINENFVTLSIVVFIAAIGALFFTLAKFGKY